MEVQSTIYQQVKLFRNDNKDVNTIIRRTSKPNLDLMVSTAVWFKKSSLRIHMITYLNFGWNFVYSCNNSCNTISLKCLIHLIYQGRNNVIWKMSSYTQLLSLFVCYDITNTNSNFAFLFPIRLQYPSIKLLSLVLKLNFFHKCWILPTSKFQVHSLRDHGKYTSFITKYIYEHKK